MRKSEGLRTYTIAGGASGDHPRRGPVVAKRHGVSEQTMTPGEAVRVVSR